MIVITSLNRTPRQISPGDIFNLVITDKLGSEVVIKETVTVAKTLDFVASFRFALEDGTCPGFHLTGIFANSAELPAEIQNAVMIDDLPADKYQRFVSSCGIKV